MSAAKGISLSGVKERNRKQIKRVIYHGAPVSRQQITDELGLTLPTITTSVAAMLTEGILTEFDSPNPSPSPNGGRRVQLLDFRPEAHFAVGAELGPYHTLLAVTDLRGNVQREAVLPPCPQNYREMLDFVSQQIQTLLEEAGTDREKLYGVGVGLPGFIESEEGVVRNTFRGDWQQRPLAGDLSSLLGLPVWIDNNARMRAIGREMFSPQSAPDTFAYFFISKGLACPLMIQNNVLAGHRASAGEIGHNTILPGGPLCPTCGRRGCLESVCGESAVLSGAAKALKEGRAPILRELLAPGESPSTAKVLEAQRRGDKAVCGIMAEAVRYLGLEAANIFNFISPSLLVIDGLIFENEENRRRFLETVRDNLYGLKTEEAKMEFLPYHIMTGSYGAAAFVVRHCLLD